MVLTCCILWIERYSCRSAQAVVCPAFSVAAAVGFVNAVTHELRYHTDPGHRFFALVVFVDVLVEVKVADKRHLLVPEKVSTFTRDIYGAFATFGTWRGACYLNTFLAHTLKAVIAIGINPALRTSHTEVVFTDICVRAVIVGVTLDVWGVVTAVVISTAATAAGSTWQESNAQTE